MRKEQAWQVAEDALDAMQADLPEPTEVQMAGLLATGAELPGLLQAADWEHEDLLEAAILERWLGGAWDTRLTPALLLCLKLRFEWAQAVLSGVRQCGFGRPPSDLPYQLLVSSWDEGGFSQNHEGFLNSHLRALLGEILPNYPRKSGE